MVVIRHIPSVQLGAIIRIWGEGDHAYLWDCQEGPHGRGLVDKFKQEEIGGGEHSSKRKEFEWVGSGHKFG